MYVLQMAPHPAVMSHHHIAEQGHPSHTGLAPDEVLDRWSNSRCEKSVMIVTDKNRWSPVGHPGTSSWWRKTSGSEERGKESAK